MECSLLNSILYVHGFFYFTANLVRLFKCTVLIQVIHNPTEQLKFILFATHTTCKKTS